MAVTALDRLIQTWLSPPSPPARPGSCHDDAARRRPCSLATGNPEASSTTERQAAPVSRRDQQFALAQNVHAEQDVEVEAIEKLEPNDLFEDERESRRIILRCLSIEADPEDIAVDLLFAANGGDRPLADPVSISARPAMPVRLLPVSGG